MNDEKLKALTARATLAQATAEEIAQLKEASRYTDCLRFTLRNDRYKNVLPDVLLNQIFDIGKAELIRQKESLLSDLLGESPQHPCADPHIGTLDSSDTWEQPIEPFETQVLS